MPDETGFDEHAIAGIFDSPIPATAIGVVRRFSAIRLHRDPVDAVSDAGGGGLDGVAGEMGGAGGYMNADFYRTFIGLTKGELDHGQLLKMILVASGMLEEEVSKGRSLKQGDKVAALERRKDWYGYLSEYFCHGRADWRGHSWQGSVSSINTFWDEFTFAGLMDYLVDQVAVMNAYAALCPVKGEVEHGRVSETLHF